MVKNRNFNKNLENASDLLANCKLDGSGLVYQDSEDEIEEEVVVENLYSDPDCLLK